MTLSISRDQDRGRYLRVSRRLLGGVRLSVDTPLLAARNVEVHLGRRGRLGRGEARPILKGVTLEFEPDRVVGLVGPSGAGKSTLTRTLMGLIAPVRGEVSYRGIPLGKLDARGRRQWRRDVQLVFQDPWGSLNPRMRVAALVEEPLAIRGGLDRYERRERVVMALGSVGLTPAGEYMERLPAELSGGERQRVAVARSLVGGPRLLILDEPVSALDAVIRLEILKVLAALKHRNGIGMLLVAHDIALVAGFCDELVVMTAGEVVEVGPPGRLLAAPQHPVTGELVAAARQLAADS